MKLSTFLLLPIAGVVGQVSLTLEIGETTSIPTDITVPAIPQNIEFCLLSDATGSFGDDQANLRAVAEDLATAISAASPNAKFGYAAFKDTSDSFVYLLLQALTDSTTDWLNAVNSLNPGGGGDTPEGQFDGIACAADINSCPTGGQYSTEDCGFSDPSDPSKKVLVVTTDATFSTDSDIINDLTSTTTALNNAGVILIGLKAPGAGSELDDLAAATGGSVQGLTSNGDNVATAILSGLEGLSTTISAVIAECDSGLAIVFAPSSTIVESGETATIATEISVTDPSVAGSTLECTVEFLGNGAVLETLPLEVTVPASNQDPISSCAYVTVESPGACEAPAIMAVDVDDGSFDPDGDSLTFTLEPDSTRFLSEWLLHTC